MNLSVAIIGLPNVGKSTLFNALLKKQQALAANYPFATIEPNVGIVEVTDERLAKLAEVVKTDKIVPATVEFYDIAGLVRGASKGEGLGNKFLSHIREVAAIAHVVRLFENSDVTHVENRVDPKQDIEIVESELIFADLATLEKQREPKMNATKDEIATFKVASRLMEELNKGIPARNVSLNEDETKAAKMLNLLTIKPVIYVFNVSEKQLENKDKIEKEISVILGSEATPESSRGQDPGQARMTSLLYLPAQLESEIALFSPEEAQEYLSQFGLSESGLGRLAKKAYEILGLISFLTAGVKEARAWTISKGTLAPQAAGVIHTDFEKNFIKADIVSYQTFVDLDGWQKCRDAGKVTLAGRDYEMKDGDVVDFKVGV